MGEKGILLWISTKRWNEGLREMHYIARCFIRELTVLKPAYTLPGGEPKISDTIASRAILMFWKEPIIWILLEE